MKSTIEKLIRYFLVAATAGSALTLAGCYSSISSTDQISATATVKSNQFGPIPKKIAVYNDLLGSSSPHEHMRVTEFVNFFNTNSNSGIIELDLLYEGERQNNGLWAFPDHIRDTAKMYEFFNALKKAGYDSVVIFSSSRDVTADFARVAIVNLIPPINQNEPLKFGNIFISARLGSFALRPEIFYQQLTTAIETIIFSELDGAIYKHYVYNSSTGIWEDNFGITRS